MGRVTPPSGCPQVAYQGAGDGQGMGIVPGHVIRHAPGGRSVPRRRPGFCADLLAGGGLDQGRARQKEVACS